MRTIPVICALVLCLACCLFPARAQETNKIEEGSLSRLISGIPEGVWAHNFFSGVSVGTNGVYVKRGDTLLMADRIVAGTNDEAEADGHVRIESNGALWVGDHITYNFTTHEIRSEQFRTGKTPVFASGSSLVGNTTNKTFTARQVVVTTDDFSDPAYEFRASRVVIVPNDYVEMWDAIVYAKGVPVFYFPYYRRNIGPRANNLNFLPGDRSIYGPYLLTTYRWFAGDNADGKIHPPYPDWTDVAELDYANVDLRRYMIDMLKYWLTAYGVDGFRCDTAFTVPVDFWEAARVELRAINPEVVIITDSGAKPALLSQAFDMDYAGNMYISVNQVIAGEQPASLIADSWEHTQEQFAPGSLHLHYTDHHNLTRATVRLGLPGALAAQVLMLSLDGVPLFYNGMEVGDATESADPALFEKLPVFWNPGGRPALRDIYRDWIKLRKTYPVFRTGEVVWLKNTAGDEVLSILRRDAKDEFLIVLNLSSRRVSGSVEDLAEAGDFQPVTISGWANPVDNVIPDFHLDGFGWLVWHRAVK